MKLLHVIPIARGITTESLSYFSSSDVSEGSLISVPIRKKAVSAIVYKIEDISEAKLQLRSSSYRIKKIENITPNDFFESEFIESAKIAGDYFVSSTGAFLGSLLPSILLKNINDLKKERLKTDKTDEIYDKKVIQANDEDRFSDYKSLIRESFAKNKSVFLCVPTIHSVKKMEKSVSRGIEEYVFTLHNSLSKKEFLKNWNGSLEKKHPVLIVGTGGFLCVPRSDIGTIILENEHSPAYKTQKRPYLDIRTFAHIYAKQKNIQIIFGDIVLRTETVWDYKNGSVGELSPLKFHMRSPSSYTVVDMREYKKQKKEFVLFSKELQNLLEKTIKKQEHLFLFTARRGLSPLTVCGDCGHTVTCENCGSPVVLHGGAKENVFLCHSCGKKRSSAEKCKNCTSWKLNTLGIGIQRTEEELKKSFPKIKIFKIDSDTTKTHGAAQKTIEEFYNTQGSILLGTEMALSYLDKPVENSGVVSVDSLFSIPDFQMQEKIFTLLLKIKEKTTKECLVQTRNPEQAVIERALTGNILDFYKNEIKNRERFSYPPFQKFIKITFEGTKASMLKETEKLKSHLKNYDLYIFPAYLATSRGKFAMHALLKIPHEEWVDKDLLSLLLSLPPHYSVRVDPQSVL